MKNLKQRRAAARYRNTMPTMTDQSQAANTDLNVIVNQFLKTGQSASKGNPIYGDFSQLPTNLRDAIDQARSVQHLRRTLPPQLRDMDAAELLTLTPEDITRILTPPHKETPKHEHMANKDTPQAAS